LQIFFSALQFFFIVSGIFLRYYFSFEGLKKLANKMAYGKVCLTYALLWPSRFKWKILINTMKYIFTIAFTLLVLSVFAQKEIKLEEVKNHIGDSVKIQAKIYGGKFLESAKGTPTFLNVGDNYPNAPLTLVIWGDVRNQFKTPPEEKYNKGYVQWITGKIELYKGKPEIVITNPNQIYDVVAAPIGK